VPEEPTVNWQTLLEALDQAYEQLGQHTRTLEQVHAPRTQCRKGCCVCCVDEITVFEVEAENIRRYHADLLEYGTPHAPGACAFLAEDGSCRIYEHRPYVCRTQGLPLRWIDENAEGEVVEMRDICPLNEAGTPIENLPGGECWTLGPFEEFLSRLQSAADGGEGRRVRLRALFAARTADAGEAG
jgi:Fe-S-cluster containining protein